MFYVSISTGCGSRLWHGPAWPSQLEDSSVHLSEVFMVNVMKGDEEEIAGAYIL